MVNDKELFNSGNSEQDEKREFQWPDWVPHT